MKFDSNITQSWIKSEKKMQSYCPSHSYLGLLGEENIVNDMNHMNAGKNERSSQGLVNYINFFRQLANNKRYSLFFLLFILNII